MCESFYPRKKVKLLIVALSAYLSDFHSGISNKTTFLPLLLIICASSAANVFSAIENPEVQFSLGVTYNEGEGIPLDDKEAVKWQRLAAQQGDAMGQNNFANLLLINKPSQEDVNKAKRYFKLAFLGFTPS